MMLQKHLPPQLEITRLYRLEYLFAAETVETLPSVCRERGDQIRNCSRPQIENARG
jgi:hypothetical protein